MGLTWSCCRQPHRNCSQPSDSGPWSMSRSPIVPFPISMRWRPFCSSAVGPSRPIRSDSSPTPTSIGGRPTRHHDCRTVYPDSVLACQSCTVAVGQCTAQPDGQAGNACAAPKVCCSGARCEHLHECNGSGICKRCSQKCPDTCVLCFHLADGSTTCGGVGTSVFCGEQCTSNADCTGTKVCATSQTARSTNENVPVCAAGPSCTAIAACS